MAQMTGIETRVPATLEDYLALPDDCRAELLGGELVLTPAPHFDHQLAVLALAAPLRAHVRSEGLGRVYVAPADVRLPTGELVQPDVFYVSSARAGIVVGTHAKGAPDLAIEVLSPDSVVRDRIVKRDTYARNGVLEFWIVDTNERTVDVYTLGGEAYGLPLTHKPGHLITSGVLPALQLAVDAVFEDLPPRT